MDLGPKKSPTKAKAFKFTGGVLVIASFMLAVGGVNPIFLIIPLYVAYLFLRRGKKHSVERGESVLKDDSRPPVVYLRSFKDEELESSVSYPFKSLAYSDKTWLAATVPNNVIQEQDALGYVFRKIGPYIALGRPGEQLLELGSSKLYASNNSTFDQILLEK